MPAGASFFSSVAGRGGEEAEIAGWAWFDVEEVVMVEDVDVAE